MYEIFQNTELTNIIQMVRALKKPKALDKARKNPIDFFAQYGINLPANVEYDIYLNDGQFLYFILPPSNDSLLNDEQIRGVIAAGSKINSASSITTVSSLSCVSCPGFCVFTGACLTTLSSVNHHR